MSLTNEEMALDTLAAIPNLDERLEFFGFHCSFQSEEEVNCCSCAFTSTMEISLYNIILLQIIGDALMAALVAIDNVRKSKTLKRVLGAILAVGNFLNSSKVCTLACEMLCYKHKYIRRPMSTCNLLVDTL